MSKDAAKERSYEKKQILFSTLIIIAIAVFVIVGSVFMYNVFTQVNSATNDYTYEVTANKAVYVDNLINDELGLAKNIASAFPDYRENSRDTLNSKLEQLSRNNEMLNIIIIEPDGTAISYRGEDINVSSREYFKSAMEGNTCFSQPIYSTPDQNMVNVIASPIYNNDEIIGVVACMREAGYYSDELNIAINSDTHRAYGCIVSSDGTIISSGAKVLPEGAQPDDDAKFFDSNIVMAAEESTRNTLIDDFSKTDVTNSFRASLDGKNYVVYYSDLKSASDLHYAAIYSEDALLSNLSRYTNGVLRLFIIFLIIIAIITLLFFITIRVTVKKLKVSNERLSAIAYIDSVTGFNTYGRFEEIAKELLQRSYRRYCLVSFDIDRFKVINDMFGHAEGNRVLKVVAQTVNRSLLDRETFARVSSDNFFILLSYKDDTDTVDRIKKIISAVSYEFADYVPVLSFGIYKIVDRNMSIRRMGDCADVARHTVKYREKGSWAFYSNAMTEAMREEKTIENEMQNALDTHEFALYLQPKFSLVGPARLTGAEALVRWIRKGSVIPPGKFIPLFEKNRFIIKLDYYILDQVCRRLKKWENEGIPPILISVNMSRVHLRDPGFVDKLSEICAAHGVSPSCIEIEITESAAYDSLDVLVDVFRQLKSYGFHISIDDFGSGYSSLNMLKDLPADVLKIDRVFLTETNNQRANDIIGYVIKMARSLGMETICEGIETDEQAQLLRSLGCDMAQGFFFAKPMPCEDFEKNILESKE